MTMDLARRWVEKKEKGRRNAVVKSWRAKAQREDRFGLVGGRGGTNNDTGGGKKEKIN